MSLDEKEWFIEAPWGRICVVAWGDCADPPVLLVHGSRDTAATFRPLVGLLPKKFYYIAIELPGNGRSDRYPPGMMISVYDLVYVVKLTARHFRWEKFVFVGHSLGALVGRLYDMSYHGSICKLVELDPVTKYITVPPNKFAEWYHRSFTVFYDQYEKMNSPKEKSPAYTRRQAIDSLKEHRGLSEEAAAATVERMTEPAGKGRIRFTADRRFKYVTAVPYAPEHLKRVYTSITTPTLTILAEDSIKKGQYKGAAFMLDEGSFPRGICRVRGVVGGHDVHFVHPERVATYVAQFLLYGCEGVESKAKLFTADRRFKYVTAVPYAPEHLKRVYTSITTPTLTILAEDSIKKGRYKGAEFMLDEGSFPRGICRVRGVVGGHDVHFVHPERVATYVAQFLLYGCEGVESKAKL